MEWIRTMCLPVPDDTYHKSRVCCWQLHPDSLVRSGQSLPESALSLSTSSFTFVFRRDENDKLFAFSPPDIVC